MTETPKSLEIPMSVIDTWKLKRPSVYILLPPDLISLVGHITLAWGMFEKALNHFLAAVLATNATTIKGKWERYSLDQRCGMLRDESAICFSATPDLLARLISILDDVEPMQIRRNALVHGRITLSINAEAAIAAEYEHRNQAINLTFTKVQLDDLYYEVIHLAGRMAQFTYPHFAPFVPPPSSQDISRLQVVLSNSPTTPPIPSMIVDPQRSFGS